MQKIRWITEIPNALTVVRLLLAVVFPLATASWHSTIIAVALVTEFLDGYLARLYHWDSKEGKALDPIADKIFFISVCLTWIWMGKLSWLYLLLMGIRDIGIAVILVFYIATGRYQTTRLIQPTQTSKLATVFQYASFFSIFWWRQAAPTLVFLTAGIASVALTQYVILLQRQRNSRDH